MKNARSSSKQHKQFLLMTAKRGKPADDPTLAVAIDRYIDQESLAQKPSSIRCIVSTLRGGEQLTKKPRSTPLARTHLGRLPTGRVTVDDILRFNIQRHDGLAANSRRRGIIHVNGLIDFLIIRGWAERELLAAKIDVPKSDSRRYWIKPETLRALLEALRSGHPQFAHPKPPWDEFRDFSFYVDRHTGIRWQEKALLVPSSYDPTAGVLHVLGKGPAEGKWREIPVAASFGVRWREHIEHYGIRPKQSVFFRRDWGNRVCGEHGWADDAAQMGGKGATATWYQDITAVAQDLPFDLAPNFDITPRVMRRTFACLHCIGHAMGKPGAMDLRSLQKALGHESLETTAIYLADVEEYLKRNLPRRAVDDLLEDILAE